MRDGDAAVSVLGLCCRFGELGMQLGWVDPLVV